MEIGFAAATDKGQIKDLLSENDLIYEDITSSHLKHFLILREDTLLLGVVGLEVLDRFALLRSLAVKSNYRNKEIGSKLLKAAEDYAQSFNVETLYLLTTTADEFFAKHGYEKADRNSAPASVHKTTEFCSLCPSTAVCMIKNLKIV
jgi:amino-acid N-acetyltransferase